MNVMFQSHPAPMTTEAFLAWPGDGSGRRFNLVDGIARPMAPATHTHALLFGNLLTLISSSISAAGLDLSALVEGAVIPAVQPAPNVRIPDIVVTAAPDAPGQVAVPSPVLAAEVLSPSNQAQTRSNIASYASIPTMQEIVLVHSQRMLIEVQQRGGDGQWTTRTLQAGDELVLASVALRCGMEAVYRRSWLLTA